MNRLILSALIGVHRRPLVFTLFHFGELGFVVGQLGANAIDYLGRRFAEEDFVGLLAFGVGDVLFELVALLFAALALRGLCVGVHLGLGAVGLECEVKCQAGLPHI